MESILNKVKEKGIVNKISLMVAEPYKINKLITDDGLSNKVENKIKKKDYPNLYKLKKSGYYDDFSFFISDMKRLPYYENKMMDINIFMEALEKLASNKRLYEYGEIPDEFGEDEETMLKTFKKYGFKVYKQKGGGFKLFSKKKIKYNLKDYEFIEYYGDEVEENEEMYMDLINNNKGIELCNNKIKLKELL
jgi:hypothetical protein